MDSDRHSVPEEPSDFERLRRHIMLPVVVVVLTVYAITAICYLAGNAVIWLWESAIGK